MSSGPTPLFDAFSNPQIKVVGSLDELLATPWSGTVNALCWRRALPGNFEEVARMIRTDEDILMLDEPTLRNLSLGGHTFHNQSHPRNNNLSLSQQSDTQQSNLSLGGHLGGQSSLGGHSLGGRGNPSLSKGGENNNLSLSPEGRIAIQTMLSDLHALQERDLLPEINCIHAYPREPNPGIVPLDVYSFHADSATAPADTYLCTYFGAASEAVRNDDAFRFSDRPEIRAALLTEFGGSDGLEFEDYLRDAGYDLHYGTTPGAQPFSFGVGHLWRIATDHPGCPVPPCIHRAPATRIGDPPRLLLIS